MADDKLYRIKTKEGAHVNEKIKEDGSKAAIQFDDKNGLKGPVDLVEVDESEIPCWLLACGNWSVVPVF